MPPGTREYTAQDSYWINEKLSKFLLLLILGEVHICTIFFQIYFYAIKIPADIAATIANIFFQ